MATLDVLTYGFALNTDQGAFGYSTNSLLRVGSHNILIDTGPSSRRPFLYRALQSRNLTTDDIDMVILTHMHWDHCQNTDLFGMPGSWSTPPRSTTPVTPTSGTWRWRPEWPISCGT